MRPYAPVILLLLCSAFGPGPAVKPSKLRTVVRVEYGRTTPAWERFVQTGRWEATWDVATRVPSRIWGSGMPAPGAMSDPAKAAAFARAVLREHIALLAPGASADDFVLVSNHTDGDIRSVGFVQMHGGRRVVGGQVSFRFKADRLFVIGSEALPDVKVALPRARLARTALHTRATTLLRAEFALPDAPVTQPGAEVIVPLVGDAGVLGYRIGAPVTIDGGADGKYLAYVDPATAELIDASQLNQYATGTVLYRGVDRHPLRGRVNRPAPRAHVTVAGAAQTTSTDGSVSWAPDSPQPLATDVKGDLVEVVNKGPSGERATAQLSIAPNGQTVWDATADGEADAQVVTYLAVNRVKEYVRANIDAQMKGLDDPIKANVNIGKSCNAFFDGQTINFFSASQSCQNTGLLDDVIFHEYGHVVHSAEIIEGVGRHDGAMGEGAADFLAAEIVDDPAMGRGFFYTEEPLRQLDPEGAEFRWPDHLGEIHGTGRIYGGAFWDLRKALIADLGASAGSALVNKLFVATLRRATSIPTSFVEALAADDNDGNLDNGTPNECAIRDAFGRHGLRFASGAVDAPATLVTTAATTDVRFQLSGLSTRCNSDAIDRVLLIWLPGVSRAPSAGTAILTASGPGLYTATLPLPQDDFILYSVRVVFADGSTLTLADNLADRYYQLYQGETVPLYCESFDEDPFARGWATATSDGSPSPWKWIDGRLEQEGIYAKESASSVRLPPIDIGQWSDVHLQYRRKLEVEDSQFDRARITVDGVQAWVNATANRGDSSSLHHIDREWRFHDVRLSGIVPGLRYDIGFDLSADAGLEFEGWAIDDLCVVANPNSICGDGVVSLTEGCDDGDKNGNRPNACRTWCAKAKCGDRIVDDMEACDDGPAGSQECTPMCQSLVDEAGCCSASSKPVHLWLLVGFLLLRRRRRCSR
jgi:hypothetical protein